MQLKYFFMTIGKAVDLVAKRLGRVQRKIMSVRDLWPLSLSRFTNFQVSPPIPSHVPRRLL